jgi:hypothetical protein
VFNVVCKQMSNKRQLLVIFIGLFFGLHGCGGGDPVSNSLGTSLQNRIASDVFSLFAFALTGTWVEGGIGVSLDSNSIVVRDGCGSFNFNAPYDATDESGGVAIRGRFASTGDVVLFLRLDDSSGATKLALTLRDSSSKVLISAPNMRRTNAPLAEPTGC